MTKNKKQDLKDRIALLNKQTSILETEYKKLKHSVAFQIGLSLLYVMYILIGKSLVPETIEVIDFEMLSLMFFGATMLLYYKRTKVSIGTFKKRSQEGYVLFESVVNFVDWQAYRKKQLHNDNDEAVVNSISKFTRIAQARLSPTRDKGLLVSLLMIYSRLFCIMAFVFGVYVYSNEIYNSLESVYNQIGDESKLYYLAALSFAFITGFMIITWSYLMRKKLEDLYTAVMNKYLFNFTQLCRFVARFSNCIIYKDNEVEYVEELKSLIDRFSSIGELSIARNRGNVIKAFDINRLCSLSENVNHLWYYLDDKLRYMDDGISFDEVVAATQKDEIKNELAKYTDRYVSSKVNWSLLRNVTGDFYCDYWQKVENLPHSFNYGRKMLISTRNILVMSIVIITISFLIPIIAPRDTLQAILIITLNLLVCCLITYRMVTTRRRIWTILSTIKKADVFERFKE